MWHSISPISAWLLGNIPLNLMELTPQHMCLVLQAKFIFKRKVWINPQVISPSKAFSYVETSKCRGSLPASQTHLAWKQNDGLVGPLTWSNKALLVLTNAHKKSRTFLQADINNVKGCDSTPIREWSCSNENIIWTIWNLYVFSVKRKIYDLSLAITWLLRLYLWIYAHEFLAFALILNSLNHRPEEQNKALSGWILLFIFTGSKHRRDHG